MDLSSRAISCQNLETASTIRAETVTGSHLFKIFGYSLTKGIGVGKSYESDVFTIGGFDWMIEYYPDGHTDEYKDFISFSLLLESEATYVKARVTFTILQQNGVPSDMSLTSPVRTFERQEVCWGYPEFAKRTKFEESECLKDDAFTVKCIVTVVKGANLEVINSVNISPSNLNQHFVNLLESEKGADVTFLVNGERFKAHRGVLATRSAVFNAELFGNMRGKRRDAITVEDIEAPVFKSMLHFIYSDSLPDFVETSDDDGEKHGLRLMAQHLLVAADRYDLERLKLMCEDLLCKNLDASTVATTLVLAEQHNCSQLKAECLKFVRSPEVFKAVALTDGFHHLMKSCPSLLKDQILETVSAMRAVQVTGSHLFKIFGYSLTREIGIGECCDSDVFTIGGYDWIIEYYPDGCTDRDFISFALQLESETTKVKARYTFTILQLNGVPSDMSITSEICTFSSTSPCSYMKFLRTKFEASECLKDDAFTVKCTVTVVTGTNHNMITPDGITVPPSNLNQHFVNLLESGKGADVEFEVNREKFKAHRGVLAARSAVFNAQLFDRKKRKRTDTITIDHMESPVFKSMLHFIYTDTLPDFVGTSDDDGEKQDVRFMAQHLLVAADRYDLERLRLICEDMLCKNLAVSTVASTLVLAEQHNCTQLKAKCLKFVSSPEVFQAFVLTDFEGFHNLMKSYPSILKDLL